MTTPAGATHYTYDDADRPTAPRPAGAVSYEWDATGSLLTKVKPDATTTYAYDGWPWRLTAVDGVVGNRRDLRALSLPDLGQRSRTTAPDGHATSYLYDQASLVQEIHSVAGTAAAYVWAGGELPAHHRAGAARDGHHADGLGARASPTPVRRRSCAINTMPLAPCSPRRATLPHPTCLRGGAWTAARDYIPLATAYDAAVGRFLTRIARLPHRQYCTTAQWLSVPAE